MVYDKNNTTSPPHGTSSTNLERPTKIVSRHGFWETTKITVGAIGTLLGIGIVIGIYDTAPVLGLIVFYGGAWAIFGRDA